MSVISRCLLVFVVKQKTAYEMRISDWSSDVCSSDLDEGALDDEIAGRGVRPFLEAPFLEARLKVADHRHAAAHHDAVARGVEFGREIGRASCRERVGQYV